jgi:hypothetical protein
MLNLDLSSFGCRSFNNKLLGEGEGSTYQAIRIHNWNSSSSSSSSRGKNGASGQQQQGQHLNHHQQQQQHQQEQSEQEWVIGERFGDRVK